MGHPPVHEAHHLPSFSVEIKNTGIFICMYPVSIHTVAFRHRYFIVLNFPLFCFKAPFPLFQTPCSRQCPTYAYCYPIISHRTVMRHDWLTRISVRKMIGKCVYDMDDNILIPGFNLVFRASIL